jgi:two-component system sensor histidine kinase MtrB
MHRAAARQAHPPITRRAVVDLIGATAFVWLSVLVIHRLDIPAALAGWNETHEQWAIDEFALVSLCVVAALGVFSWRRWQESLDTITQYEHTLEQLHTSQVEIASRDDLIRSVSHELRTPLTAVLGYAELLGSNDLGSEDRIDMVNTIIREGRDLSNIVEDLLTRARSEAKTLEVAAVRVNLSAQVAQVLEGRTPHERSRMSHRPDETTIGTGDPARIRQIIRNLISNALKYGDGSVAIAMTAAPDQVGLEVRNPGPAVPIADRDRIFDPYHRAAGAGRNPGGLGLGLAISRELARMMGGDLRYRREGAESVFALTLPRFLKQDAPEAPT